MRPRAAEYQDALTYGSAGTRLSRDSALARGLGPAAGDWLSGRAPRSHRGGHWFDPSIAHPALARCRARTLRTVRATRRGTRLMHAARARSLAVPEPACDASTKLAVANRRIQSCRGGHKPIRLTCRSVPCASLSLLRRRDRSVRCRARSGGGVYGHCLSRGGLYGDCLIRGGSVFEQRLALHQPGEAE